MTGVSLTGDITQRIRRALDFALLNVGVCEDPPGSNRSPEIDAWAREFDSPLGSFWCALAVAKARKTGGLWTPERYAGCCDEWVREAHEYNLISATPTIGAAVIYTNGRTVVGGRYDGQVDAVHMGLVLRVSPVLLSIEGNTTLGKYDTNGYVLALKRVDSARVLCYILP